MEKTIVFLPIIIFFGFFALLIVGFFVLVRKLFFKAKSDQWVGEVIDKNHTTKDKEGSNKLKEHFYSLKVKLENGEVHNIAVGSQFFDEVKIGDRLKKEKGKLWPEKIS